MAVNKSIRLHEGAVMLTPIPIPTPLGPSGPRPLSRLQFEGLVHHIYEHVRGRK